MENIVNVKPSIEGVERKLGKYMQKDLRVLT
jgi:hypothetical protein